MLQTGNMKIDQKENQIEMKSSFFEVLAGSDLPPAQLPVMSVKARCSGPAIWLTACAHGDEVGGVVVIQEVFHQIRKSLIKGSVEAVLLMNPTGFAAGSRYIGYSGEDLNRCFPGNPNGSLGERIADQIFRRITDTAPGLVMDLHNDWKRSVPYVVLEPQTCDFPASTHGASKKIGEAAGFYLIEDTDDQKGCLSSNLLIKGIPALTLELGESFVVNERFVQYGVQSILNVLTYLQMIPCFPRLAPFPLHDQYGRGKVLKYSDRPRCSQAGILRFFVKPGDLVEKGQPVARVFDFFGRLRETLTANGPAIILGTSDSSVAYPGMAPVAYGTF